MPDENKPATSPPPVPPITTPPPMAHDASVSPPPPVVDIPPVITTPGKGKKKSGAGKKMIVTLLGLFVLVGGIAAGVILVQRQQDIREKADCISCPGGTCPDGWTYGSDDCAPQATCDQRHDEACADHQDDGNGDACTGQCDKNGCTEDCPDIWPVSFYCRGLSHAACGELHESFLGFGVPAGTIEYEESIEVRAKGGGKIQISPWCTTVQADSNTENGACIVVFIGDQGKWCIDDSCGRSSTECSSGVTDTNGDGRVNQNDLDWDCGEEETASCDSCTAYDENWEAVDLTDISVGQTVYFATLGSSVPPGLITKARFKINGIADDSWCDVANLIGDDWCETTTKHDTYGYYVQYTIPSASSYRVTSAVYAGEDLGWIPPEPLPPR